MSIYYTVLSFIYGGDNEGISFIYGGDNEGIFRLVGSSSLMGKLSSIWNGFHAVIVILPIIHG